MSLEFVDDGERTECCVPYTSTFDEMHSCVQCLPVTLVKLETNVLSNENFTENYLITENKKMYLMCIFYSTVNVTNVMCFYCFNNKKM